MKTKFKDIVTDQFLVDMAENHIDAWKDRYFRKSKSEIKHDLSVNHDPSLEIEYTEQQLGRELTDSETDRLVRMFNNKVAKIIY